jgi:hypothetical protein
MRKLAPFRPRTYELRAAEIDDVAHPPDILHRDQAVAARGGVDEHALALLEFDQLRDGHLHRGVDRGEGRRVLLRPGLRLLH